MKKAIVSRFHKPTQPTGKKGKVGLRGSMTKHMNSGKAKTPKVVGKGITGA